MTTPDTEPRYLLSRNQFVLLCIATFGLYQIWWIFKSWRFFRDHGSPSIHSAIRTQLSIFYLIPLLKRIRSQASGLGDTALFSPVQAYFLFGLLSLSSILPEPFSVLSVFSFYPLLRPFDALNSVIRKTEGDQAAFQLSFNRRQSMLLIVGCFVWMSFLWGIIGQLLPSLPTE